MYIHLILNHNNTISINVKLSNEKTHDSQWLFDWLNRNPNAEFNKTDANILINDIPTIENFINAYVINSGKGTENPLYFFHCKNSKGIFFPMQLKNLYNEIKMRADDLQFIPDELFEKAINNHNASKYLSFDMSKTSDDIKNVMVIAPIKNIHLLSTIKKCQELIREQFQLHGEEAECFPHISFGIPLTINSDELRRLKTKLQNLEINVLEIQLAAIKIFPDNTIYIEINDSKRQLSRLNEQIITTIKEANIPCDIRYSQYIPHISLYLKPATQLTNTQTQTISLDKGTYYLNSVILSESIVSKGIIEYKNIFSLPIDKYLATSAMEKDYFAAETEGLYKSLYFDNNPVADYYRLLNKLDKIESNQENKLDECRQIYKKILNFNTTEGYPDDPVTKALQLYARGLIFQYPYHLNNLLKSEKIDETREQQKALTYFNEAYHLGYLGALKNIGILNYQLGHCESAMPALAKAISIGETDAYTEQYFQQCQKEVQSREHDRRKCIVM
jgi:hypothetical protein